MHPFVSYLIPEFPCLQAGEYVKDNSVMIVGILVISGELIMEWKDAQKMEYNNLIGCQAVSRPNFDGDESNLVVCRTQDDRVLVFLEWWSHVYEFPNNDTFEKAMAQPADEDYLFDVSLAINRIRIE